MRSWQLLVYKHKQWIIASAVIIAAILLMLYLVANPSKHQRTKPAQSVVLAVAKSSNVPVYLSALGSVTPTHTVTVKTQVNGQLLRVLFQEGQMVKAGDLLAEIDPQPFQAAFTQSEGQLERDRATLVNARLDLKRYQTLWKQNSVSKQTLDTQTALVKQLEGTVKLDEGLVASARVNLAYCRITSPINGRVGLRLVDPGNFVQTSDTGLVVITTLNPITVLFTLPEDSIPAVMKSLNSGKKLVTQAYDREQKHLLATGTLLTIDNQIDPTTGTVKLRAQFPNNHNQLFPNQFVNVQLLVDILQKATLIPTAAIQQGVNGPFVYVTNNNETVNIKPVIVGVTEGDNTTITSGVMPGQSVVVEGADKLTDGATIKA